MEIYGVTGWKNTGKTTLVEKLIKEMTARGIRVSTVKHAHHDVEIDQPGKDSHRHRMAGAQQVILSTEAGWALMSQTPHVPLAALVSKLDLVDLVLVEGYKHDTHPKIETHRKGQSRDLVGADNPSIRAVASDDRDLETDLDRLDLNNPSQIADYILADVGWTPAPLEITSGR
ncbi:molybdopterin-guanine dinucleotide biosynthesis protein B [Tateyamaria sp.]|uniref:molybdopterin-guanine dinucleotide biosynthesis protein B n=1 Tax=Tateyamaria sp. TaxID=1929288 RepID=UPI003B227FA1